MYTYNVCQFGSGSPVLGSTEYSVPSGKCGISKKVLSSCFRFLTWREALSDRIKEVEEGGGTVYTETDI